MWAIVPIKQLDLAKGRLADELSPAERRALVRAMAEDVLACLRVTPGIERVLVVTREAEVAALARAHGADVLEEAGGGLNAAVCQGAAAAEAAGAAGILVVHGDLPLASPAAFARILATHGNAPAVTLVPDARRDGSNCLACSPPQVIPFRFGRNSAPAHLAEARERGIDPVLLELPELALDVDAPADLATLLAEAREGRSVAFLRASGIASRFAGPPEAGPATTQTRCLGGNA